jgi:MATE family multidrug resistance protein
MTKTHASGQGPEWLALLRIAAPLMISYVADVMGVVITKAVVGRLGYLELAGVGVAADLGFQFVIVTMGFFSVVGVLVAGALGAREHEKVAAALLQGLWLALVIGLALTVLVWNMDVLLGWAGQAPDVIAIAGPFSHGFAFAVLPMILFSVLRATAAAMMRTGMVMAITIASVTVQYFVMTGFVHGAVGLPGLGAAGAGYGWAAIAWLRCLLLGLFVIWLLRRENIPLPHGEYARAIWRTSEFVRLGLPVAGIVGLESGLFASASLMSGWLGPIPLAAYQMLMGWIAIPFVISLGLADAAMVRVSYWMGAEEPGLARRAGNLGMLIGVGIPAILVLIPLIAPGLVTRAFLDANDPGYGEIATLVASLLVICAVFQIFDGLQAVASHALRGLKDAVMPLVIAGTGYWVIGLSASYLLAFKAGWGAHGLWWGVALGLAFTGSLLAYRFERLSNRFTAA